MKRLGGGEVNSEDLFGKRFVLLGFWSIFCEECVEEIPELIEFHKKYEEKGLTVIGVNLDGFGAKRVQPFVDGLGYEIPYPIVIDADHSVTREYAAMMLPTVILIDRRGKIAKVKIGYKKGDVHALDSML